MHVQQARAKHFHACLIAIQPILKLGAQPGFQSQTVERQDIVERAGGSDRLQHRLRRGSNRRIAIHLPEQEIVRLPKPVMDHCVHLDHVQIAAEHQRFLRLTLESSGAMLDIPLVGERFVRSLTGG